MSERAQVPGCWGHVWCAPVQSSSMQSLQNEVVAVRCHSLRNVRGGYRVLKFLSLFFSRSKSSALTLQRPTAPPYRVLCARAYSCVSTRRCTLAPWVSALACLRVGERLCVSARVSSEVAISCGFSGARVRDSLSRMLTSIPCFQTATLQIISTHVLLLVYCEFASWATPPPQFFAGKIHDHWTVDAQQQILDRSNLSSCGQQPMLFRWFVCFSFH